MTFCRAVQKGAPHLKEPGCWVLMGVLVVFLMRGWWPPGVPISPRREIVPEFGYAWLAREHLRQGWFLTDWSPYEFAGFPWLRYIPYPIYYVVGGLSLLAGVSLEWVYRGVFWATFVLAGAGAFEYVHGLTRSYLGGLAAGIVYVLMPFHTHVTVEVFTHSLGWALVPWPFLLYERVRGRRGWPGWVALGALLAFFPLTGIEYTLLLSVFLGVYLCWREAEGVLREGRPWRESVALFAVVGAVAVGCSAFIVVPGLLETSLVGIHAKHASGAAMRWDLLREYAMPPQALLATLLQRLRVRLPVSLPAVYRSYQAMAWYLGWSVLGLAVLGALRPPRRGLGWLVGGLALLGVVRAGGPWIPGNVLLYLPVIGKLTPFRSLGMVVFFLAVLAGFGTTALHQWGQKRWKGRALAGVALCLVVAELWRPAAGAFVSWPAYFSPAEQEAYHWVEAQPGDFRVWEFPQDHRDEYLFTYSLPQLPRPRFGGYFDNGAPLHMWRLAMGVTHPPGVLHPLTGPALRLYSTRYVLLRRDRANYTQALDGFQSLGFAHIAFQNAEVTVLEDPDYLPYARWRSEAVLFVGEDALEVLGLCLERGLLPVHEEADPLEAWTSEELARFESVVLGEGANLTPEAEARLRALLGERLISLETWEPGLQTPSPEGVALRWERLGPLEIRLWVQSPQDGWLEVAEAWYPHWRVKVDGRPARLLRTDAAFQGVWLPAGAHEVRFVYRWPAYLWASFVISGASLVFVAGALGWAWIRRRRGR